jgi:hypothetical protein
MGESEHLAASFGVPSLLWRQSSCSSSNDAMVIMCAPRQTTQWSSCVLPVIFEFSWLQLELSADCKARCGL